MHALFIANLQRAITTISKCMVCLNVNIARVTRNVKLDLFCNF